MSKLLVFASIAFIVILSACTAPATQAPAQPATTAPTTVQTEVPPGPTTEAAVPTSASPEVPTPTTEGPCTDLAAFVADVTVPDYSHFDQREAFTKTWRIKNVGTCTWTADYKAVYSSGDALGAPTSIALSETAPNATVDISAKMAAPARDGKFEIFYQLNDAAGDAIPIDAGNTLWALITVGKVVAVAPATPTPAPVTVTIVSGSTGPGLTTASCVSQANPDFISQTFSLINAARAANGLPALTLNAQLTTAAQSHSEDMACNSYLSHTGWNGSTSDSRIAAAGYAASLARENIYAQPPQYGGNPQAAVSWWMSDPIHRDAILNAQVTDIGIGYAAYSRSELGGYFTVDFAAP